VIYDRYEKAKIKWWKRGLFFLEPWYSLWPVGIDKSWPTCEFTIFNALNQLSKYTPTHRNYLLLLLNTDEPKDGHYNPLNLFSCSFRPYNTTLNLSSNLEHWKLWTRMYRPRFIDTDWPQRISRLQEEKPSNPFIWFLLFHSDHRSHRQYNYV
jgi:hypothetical protein